MTFTNSILAGTTLVRDAIQSEGFAAGSTGWQIERNGDAEFNDIDARGAFVVGDTDAEALAFRTSSGRAIMSYFLNGSVQFTHELDESSSGIQYMFWTIPGLNDPTLFFDDRQRIWMHSNFEAGVVFDDSTGTLKKYWMSDFGSNNYIDVFTIENWTALNLVSDWTARGSPYNTPSAIMTVENTIKLTGSFNVGTTGSPHTIATLPKTRMHPSNECIIHGIGGSTSGAFEVAIRTNGDIDVYGAPNSVFALDGAEFPLDAI